MNEITNNTITMTSLEMIELINNSRKEDDAVLQHKNFLAKVPQVLGDEPAKILAGQYKAGNGQMQPCYRFPKREACLMAMSYSYELQAKVFDHMTALETKLAERDSFRLEPESVKRPPGIESSKAFKMIPMVVRAARVYLPRTRTAGTTPYLSWSRFGHALDGLLRCFSCLAYRVRSLSNWALLNRRPCLATGFRILVIDLSGLPNHRSCIRRVG